MSIYNLIEYNDSYEKTSESLSWYHKDDPNANITNSE